MNDFIIGFLALALLFAGLIWLQFFLSNKQSWWLGLIIPVICSLFIVIRMGSMIATAAPTFIISNIPTLIFLAIYFVCRDKRKKNLELEKMNIQDLD